MEQTEQAKFESWAIVEVMGHQSHVGFVTTEAYGPTVLFRVDTPALPERQYTLTRPEHTENGYFPAGTLVKRPGTESSSVLLGAASIYRIRPCTEEAAHVALDRTTPRPLMCLSLPAAPALPAAIAEDDEDEEDPCEDDGRPDLDNDDAAPGN